VAHSDPAPAAERRVRSRRTQPPTDLGHASERLAAKAVNINTGKERDPLPTESDNPGTHNISAYDWKAPLVTALKASAPSSASRLDTVRPGRAVIQCRGRCPDNRRLVRSVYLSSFQLGCEL